MLRLVLLVGACLLIATTACFGQAITGSIVGTVTDPGDAVVASAEITVSNMGTGSTFRTTTDSAGNYVVTPLQVGLYSVAVEVSGFVTV
jgi:hypothetical protein